MPDAVVAEQPETQVAETEQGCPVKMFAWRRCGRPIYAAPEGVDKEPVCLMHSHDPDKDDAAFQAEFERILRDAGEGVADFSFFIFPSSDYSARRLEAECVFCGATFAGVADFLSATFRREASFSRAKFRRNAVFCMARFSGKAHFSHGVFSGVADIRFGTFEGDVDFMWTEFKDIAEFTERAFKGTVSFEGACFEGAARFRKTLFPKDTGPCLGPIFVDAHFAKPGQVVFYKTDLARALFHNCGASKLVFRDVEWGKRTNGKSMVFEEVADPHSRVMEALKPSEDSVDDRNYRLISELYHELKKNYDESKDYWTAGDFHYGEMEMRRLHSPYRCKLLRCLHRNLGLVAWHKIVSEYGESYVRPALLLVVCLVAFIFAYPWPGLRPSARSSAREPAASRSPAVAQASTPELSYANYRHYHSIEPGGPRLTAWSLFGYSAMTTLGVAAFQRDLAYEPSYPWGRLLAIFEILLTSTLLALFLLAVRRQFRR
jgi:uncharacterized protein YjbI with pentapeptide repeats